METSRTSSLESTNITLLNNSLACSLFSKLTAANRARAAIALLSSQAPILREVKQVLGDKFSTSAAARLAEEMEDRRVTHPDLFLADKILDPQKLNCSLKESFERQLLDVELLYAVDYYTKNLKHTSSRRPFIKRAYEKVGEAFGAMSSYVKLGLMYAGHSLKEIGEGLVTTPTSQHQTEQFAQFVRFILNPINDELAERAHQFIDQRKYQGSFVEITAGKLMQRVGKAMFEYPIRFQLLSDILDSTTYVEDEGKKQQIIDHITTRYGEDFNHQNVFHHPDFVRLLSKSFVLNRTYYEGARQIVGWATFGSLIRLPGTDLQMPYIAENFRYLVDSYGMNNFTAFCAGALGVSMLTRVAVDCWVLKKHNMSPDALELALSLSSGKVDQKGNLKANPVAGVIGAPIDVLVSSVTPPFSFAWIVDPPYSIPAYILAITADQVVFSTANLLHPYINKVPYMGKRKKRAKQNREELQNL